MKININNNSNQSFLFKSLKVARSLGWAVVAILALPTIVGSYLAFLALKKAVEIWNRNDKPDTKKADEVALKVFSEGDHEKNFVSVAADFEEEFVLLEEAFEENFVIEAPDKDCVKKTPQQEKEAFYENAIKQFKELGCLGSLSAEAYLDYLKHTERNLDFHFNTSLLYNSGIELDKFLASIKEEVEKTPSLTFVPFLLAGNLLREQHIVVAVINKTSKQIEYFDPKGNQLYSMFGRLIDRNLAQWDIQTQQFLEKLSQAIFPDIEPKIIRNINGPQPLSNKVDCGAHALDFIQARMNSDFIQSKDSNYFETSLSSDGKKLREEMAFTLQAKLKNDDKISNTVSDLKSLARRSGLTVSREINTQDVPEEEDRIAIAKIAVQTDGKDTSLLIKNYKIQNQEALVEIAKVVARQDALGLSRYIQNYGIKDKQALVEIAQVAAEQPNARGLSYWIKQYIPEEEERIALAKMEAQQKKGSVTSIQRKYTIKNQEALTEIAEILSEVQTDTSTP